MLPVVPFAKAEDIYNLCIHYLKGPMADRMREESGVVFAKGVKQTHEEKMQEHLLAWAQCNLIPLFTSKNQKVSEMCNSRPDIVWTLPDIQVMLECDAHAHQDYDKQQEMSRMQELFHTATTQIVFIRFNPSLQGSTTELKFATLLAVLMNVFAKKQEYIGTGKSLIYLFYPEKMNVWYPASNLQALVSSKRPKHNHNNEPDL